LSTRFTLLGFDKAMALEGAGERAYGEWTSDSEEHWTKWFALARDKQLSKGRYRNLYTIGFDLPEAHAISRDGRMYYAFFADAFDGELELRGLSAGVHRVVDYENDVDAGEVVGPTGRLKAAFEGHLLLECTPAAQ
ncbi:MAG: alpha-galactosidase, partial [Planctomycetes bacterium]|nr:alpha-galactosidase [Planctomycetota bacterium]